MDNLSAGEEAEISESEIDDYSETPYLKLLCGKYKVKVNGILRCPFCSGKKKQDYKYKELMAHASGVSKGSASRSALQKANHLALAKYLQNELAGDAEEEPLPPRPPPEAKPGDSDIYVVPWMGLVINPLKETDEKEVLLDSAYWSKRLSRFKPSEVNAFWVEQDSVVAVIAKFNSDWKGFASAIDLEQEFEDEGCSKKDWMERKKRGDSSEPESKAYGWCARAEDYNSQGPIGEYLSKEGKLTTVSDFSKEYAEGRNNVLEEHSNRVAMSNEDLNTVQCSYNKLVMTLQRVLDEKEDLHKAFAKETKSMQEMYFDNVKKILEDKERCNDELEKKMRELESWSKDLERKEAVTELERQKLDEDKKKSHALNISLQLASREQKNADESVLRLVEEHKRQTEEAMNEIIQLETQLNTKHELEMEIQELKGKLQVMKYLVDDDDEAVKQNLMELNDKLEDKKTELEELDQFSSDLMTRERQSNDEIQSARKKLIAGLIGSLGAQTDIGIKRMGEIDEKPFMNVCKQRYSADEAAAEAATLCSTWQEKVNDPTWLPFRHEGTEEVIDEEDEQLKKLRGEWGEEVHNAVKTALEEMNEYNPSGRYATPELWNFKQERKATLKEVITFISNDIKSLKKRKRP